MPANTAATTNTATTCHYHGLCGATTITPCLHYAQGLWPLSSATQHVGQWMHCSLLVALGGADPVPLLRATPMALPVPQQWLSELYF